MYRGFFEMSLGLASPRKELDRLFGFDAIFSVVFGSISLLAPHSFVSHFSEEGYNHNVHETLRYVPFDGKLCRSCYLALLVQPCILLSTWKIWDSCYVQISILKNCPCQSIFFNWLLPFIILSLYYIIIILWIFDDTITLRLNPKNKPRLYGCLRLACGWILWHVRDVDDGRFRKHICEALFVCYVLQALGENWFTASWVDCYCVDEIENNLIYFYYYLFFLLFPFRFFVQITRNSRTSLTIDRSTYNNKLDRDHITYSTFGGVRYVSISKRRQSNKSLWNTNQ